MRQEWRKADDLNNNKRANTVGFALTMLQRQLASSPEAIYQSLRRRRERLEKKLREVELMYRAALIRAPGADLLDWNVGLQGQTISLGLRAP